jgi:hypothetical protein
VHDEHDDTMNTKKNGIAIVSVVAIVLIVIGRAAGAA